LNATPHRTAQARLRITRSILFSFALLLASNAWAAKSYPVRGVVLKVNRPAKTIFVSCDAIPGFMEAMAMSYAVRDAKQLDGIAPGSMIDFTLVVAADTSYAENIRVHGFESLEQDPLAARRLKLLDQIASPDGAPKPLDPGQHVPDFTLIDQTGQRVILSQFAGKVVVVSFMYTRCALPNYCFRLSNNLGRLQKRFANQLGQDLILLSITFDPVHDQPEQLTEYGKIWHADPKGWHLLTGPVPDIQAVCRQFGMSFFPDEGLMIHSLHTVVIDRQGNLSANLEGNEFSSEQLGDLVQVVMDDH
jgi:protein SCO1/2